MLVIEGPDGGGKTSLVQQLHKRYHLPVAPKVVSSQTEVLENLADWVDRENRLGFQGKIYDRHRLISGPIYSTILGRAPDPCFTDVAWVLSAVHRFYELKPVIIYCLPPIEVVRANVVNDDDNRVIRDRIDSIYEAYLARAAADGALSPYRTIIYDYTTDGKEKDPLGPIDWLVWRQFGPWIEKGISHGN